MFTGSPSATPFYQAFYTQLVQEIFAVMTGGPRVAGACWCLLACCRCCCDLCPLRGGLRERRLSWWRLPVLAGVCGVWCWLPASPACRLASPRLDPGPTPPLLCPPASRRHLPQTWLQAADPHPAPPLLGGTGGPPPTQPGNEQRPAVRPALRPVLALRPLQLPTPVEPFSLAPSRLMLLPCPHPPPPTTPTNTHSPPHPHPPHPDLLGAGRRDQGAAVGCGHGSGGRRRLPLQCRLRAAVCHQPAGNILPQPAAAASAGAWGVAPVQGQGRGAAELPCPGWSAQALQPVPALPSPSRPCRCPPPAVHEPCCLPPSRPTPTAHTRRTTAPPSLEWCTHAHTDAVPAPLPRLPPVPRRAGHGAGHDGAARVPHLQAASARLPGAVQPVCRPEQRRPVHRRGGGAGGSRGHGGGIRCAMLCVCLCVLAGRGGRGAGDDHVFKELAAAEVAGARAGSSCGPLPVLLRGIEPPHALPAGQARPLSPPPDPAALPRRRRRSGTSWPRCPACSTLTSKTTWMDPTEAVDQGSCLQPRHRWRRQQPRQRRRPPGVPPPPGCQAPSFLP